MKNNIKMIITDLDRTLLNNDRQITEYTKNVFNKCIKNGIKVVFATARPLRVTTPFFNSILPHAVACHNGAVVYVNNKLIYQCGIKPIIVKGILKNILENYPQAKLAYENNDQIYSNFDVSTVWDNVETNTFNIEELPETDIDKIVIQMESIDKINEVKKYLPNNLYLEINEGRMGLVMNKGATKWNAIEVLLKYYDIEIENTIAFGDDLNDIEMIENCGIGVAVENGIEEIKSKAKYICENNNENGTAKWIEKNILKASTNM